MEWWIQIVFCQPPREDPHHDSRSSPLPTAVLSPSPSTTANRHRRAADRVPMTKGEKEKLYVTWLSPSKNSNSLTSAPDPSRLSSTTRACLPTLLAASAVHSCISVHLLSTSRYPHIFFDVKWHPSFAGVQIASDVVKLSKDYELEVEMAVDLAKLAVKETNRRSWSKRV